MKKILLYGPIAKGKVVGGYDRMNGNIISAFHGDDQVEIVPFPILKTTLKKPFKQILYPFIYLWSIIYDYIRLNQAIKDDSIDILHITTLHRIFIIRESILIFFAKKYNLKIIFDIRAGNFIKFYENRKLTIFYRYCLTKSDKVLVEGERYINYLENKGIESEYFPNCVSLNYTFAKKNSSHDTYYFIYVGRVIKEKGIEDSIVLLEELREKHKLNLEFHIIGEVDGKYKNYIYKNYSKSDEFVVFEGYKNMEQINSFLEKADFFMFLSKWRGEGHSNSINEVMSSGTPVFYYDNGFTREIIDNDNFLVDDKNLKVNASRIYEIITNKDLIKEESLRLRLRVSTEFSLDKMKTKLLQIYSSL